jgi:predicted nucleic acid-binding protein
MRVLLDTNIVIHREATTVVSSSIGFLFRWLDKLKCEKCIHPITLAEIGRHKDERVRKSFETKLQSYVILKSVAPPMPAVSSLSANLDKTENDRNDSTILNELVAGRVDAIISEDIGVHSKATLLQVSDSVYSIDSFLEKVTAENPDLLTTRFSR